MEASGWGDCRRVYGMKNTIYVFAQRVQCNACSKRVAAHSQAILEQMEEWVSLIFN